MSMMVSSLAVASLVPLITNADTFDESVVQRVGQKDF
jgi:hypothetical protein